MFLLNISSLNPLDLIQPQIITPPTSMFYPIPSLNNSVFRSFLTEIIPSILKILNFDWSENNTVSQKSVLYVI